MNELKLMAMKAKSRLLNKGIRDIYSGIKDKKENKKEELIKPSIDLVNETNRKKYLLNMVKKHF